VAGRRFRYAAASGVVSAAASLIVWLVDGAVVGGDTKLISFDMVVLLSCLINIYRQKNILNSVLRYFAESAISFKTECF
jgi:hypothetical protein